MKKLLLLLLIAPMIGLCQDNESTIDLNINNLGYFDKAKKGDGLKYIGSGKYTIKGTKFYGSEKGITKDLTETISELAENSNANYKIISS
jgi:hypothetical protein